MRGGHAQPDDDRKAMELATAGHRPRLRTFPNPSAPVFAPFRPFPFLPRFSAGFPASTSRSHGGSASMILSRLLNPIVRSPRTIRDTTLRSRCSSTATSPWLRPPATRSRIACTISSRNSFKPVLPLKPLNGQHYRDHPPPVNQLVVPSVPTNRIDNHPKPLFTAARRTAAPWRW